MAVDDQNAAEEQGAYEAPGLSPHDPLTYDPTQGPGSPAWQASVRASMELNAQMRRN